MAPRSSDPPRIVLAVNPAARHATAASHVVVERLRELGCEPRLVVSPAIGGCVEIAREAEAEMVVAVGGDGTLGEVCRGLLDRARPATLGVIPAGTGNDSARVLGLPLEPREAASVLLEGEDRPVDLGEINGRPFMGIAVLGFAGDVGRVVNRWKSRHSPACLLGKHMYPAAALWLLARRPPGLAARVETAERGSAECDVFTVLVGNQPGVGGVFLPCPEARTDDGKLDVCTIRASCEGRRLSLRQQLRTLSEASSGAHVGLPWVETLATAEPLRLAFEVEVAALADGDEIPSAREFTLRPLPAALSIRLPAAGAK